MITTERNAYAVGTSIRAKVHVSNLSDCTLYVLKESWSGPVWKDRLGKRFVIAHDAFTAARQEQLWGGGTLLEIYRPEFYEVAPGQQRTLRWDLGDAIESGTWRLEGRISTLLDVAPFSGLQGTAAAEAIAKTDVVIPCLGKTIVIDGAAER